jgi:hypothetical protein
MVFALYKPILYLHILAAFLYILSHGASAAAAYRLRHESQIERIRALLDLSGSTFSLMYVSLLVVVLAGVAMGFMGRWWAAGWIWTSLALLLAIVVSMSLIASRHFHRVRKAVGLPFLEGTKEHAPVAPGPPDELAGLLVSGKPHLITLIGLGGWAVILALMVFKPF